MTSHRRTDPACHYHRIPQTRFQRWRYDRMRGHPCQTCQRVRAMAANPFWANYPIWRDDTKAAS